MILNFLKENYSHPQVDEIFLFVKQKLPRISKKTVYRNLQFLAQEGLIQEVEVKGVKRYEPKSNPHHHLICKKCGIIKDVAFQELISHAINIGKQINDFDVEFAHVHFHGLCNNCKEELKNDRRK
jgi:Fur family ferric uptake transcriptional regulator